MRFFTGIAAAALSGLATAAADDTNTNAKVFHLLTKSRWQQIPQETPELPKEVARHIFLQRTSKPSSYGSDLRDLPESVDTTAAVSYIARYGKKPLPIFSNSGQQSSSSQLVVIIEGATPEIMLPLELVLFQTTNVAGFVIPNPPSAAANSHLMDLFHSLGVAPSPRECDLASAINPFDRSCYPTTTSAVLKYDLKKSPSTIEILLTNLPRLTKFVEDGDLEATLVLMPESSRSSKINHWSAAAAGNADLRKRQNVEAVISDVRVPAAATKPPGSLFIDSVEPVKAAAKPRIPQCFNSFNACMKQTNNCTGHGSCLDKYTGKNTTASAAEDGPKVCFVCACERTTVDPGKGQTHVGIKTVSWGGNMCQKKDVSVPFWLLTGFTVTIIGAVTFAIGLLYDVGSEPLPGVIGAGVIRSSK